jgi:elongation factor P hydroxylase
MKTRINIEIEVELNDFVYLEYVLKDISHYLKKGVQSRATHFKNADYNFHVHMPVRKGGKINYTENSIVFTHKSKIK